ncbi:glycerophosphodiester phosphodiesterase [Ramlibacter montanisoli]|uniref:Glycerophosphodiester phosphodiesterase n=1 Tax=Ramlibacter montanisoli TaxID=2732512 RepID=A0A849KAR7_9BURK|nr:glycerophosphodiester phosphodiesterase [Ramlibacter montanisoli]NNU41891.1 glycerophosphodiester phosphodiesterase [Ramlibacter montanisoli]
MKAWPYPRWVAHRGAGRLAPENTLAAFRLGAENGYRMFECDVKLSADGVPFLMHDATLERTTNGIGLGGDQPWDQLARLDAGSWHSRAHAGEPLPTFENIGRYCLANGFFLNIEIKPTPGLEAKTGEVVANHAERIWRGTELPPLLTSFRPESLQAALQASRNCRAACCWTPCGMAAGTMRSSLQCVAVVCNHALWDAATVAKAKGLGLRTLSYTVNDEWAAQRLIALGTDGIITDRVDLFSPA